jgi:hypothetical protein
MGHSHEEDDDHSSCCSWDRARAEHGRNRKHRHRRCSAPTATSRSDDPVRCHHDHGCKSDPEDEVDREQVGLDVVVLAGCGHKPEGQPSAALEAVKEMLASTQSAASRKRQLLVVRTEGNDMKLRCHRKLHPMEFVCSVFPGGEWSPVTSESCVSVEDPLAGRLFRRCVREVRARCFAASERGRDVRLVAVLFAPCLATEVCNLGHRELYHSCLFRLVSRMRSELACIQGATTCPFWICTGKRPKCHMFSVVERTFAATTRGVEVFRGT